MIDINMISIFQYIPDNTSKNVKIIFNNYGDLNKLLSSSETNLVHKQSLTALVKEVM